MSPDNTGRPAKKRSEAHAAESARLGAILRALDKRSLTFSVLLFVSFLVLAAVAVLVYRMPTATHGLGLFAAFSAFVGLRLLHARNAKVAIATEARRDVHDRHLLRLTGQFRTLPPAGHVDPGHPYAVDIDLVGPGSLQQRVDTSRTLRGESVLSTWLGAAAGESDLRDRQNAVAELARLDDFRTNLEASALLGPKLDGDPFLAFVKRPAVLGRAAVVLMHALPISLLLTYLGAKADWLPSQIWPAILVVQALLVFRYKTAAAAAFGLISARRSYVEAFGGMLVEVERARFESPLLQRLQKQVAFEHGGVTIPPSVALARLDRWAGFAEFYTQALFHFFIDLFTCYDLHVLWRLERWNSEVGSYVEKALGALAEIEALTSLANFLADDDDATMPTLVEGEPLTAVGLAHPLLPSERRIANDVALPRATSAAWIVTGSNMAGKSTLLRSVGLNLALALAGGPVTASSFRFSAYRLRASMRVDDSLEKGSSYFHAELAKLKTVVDGADEATPPIFFLLDEMLRGTNARARHLGAHAILEHLVKRGHVGLAATHDVALAVMEEEHPGGVLNVHFTDVIENGEMVFDYRLRPGVVQTSNALRLLQMAGIEMPAVDNRVQ